MWSPTHIQVTVQRAKDLLTKGKNGTNNCFVTIALGKEKYQTSVKEKSEVNVSWNEECELKIPDQGNRAELILTCLHRNNLGIDEFLGQATLPLNEMDVYDRPRSKWFKLQSKPGKEKKNKERGELEVRISFIVKSGSLTDLSKKEKHKSSVGQLASSVGGSLLSIGTIEKRKSIKKFAKSLGSKMHLHSKKKNKDGDDLSFNGSFVSIDTSSGLQSGSSQRYGQRAGEADPGVISEDEDEFVFDNLSHKSSGSSLNVRSSNNGLQVPQKNYVPRNPSPLLSVADNQTFKGNDIMEETEYYNQQNVNLYEQQANEFEEETLTLPPPSNEQKQSLQNGTPNADRTINDWDLKPYTQKSESLKRNPFASVYASEALKSQNADITTEGDEVKDYDNDFIGNNKNNSNFQSNGGIAIKPKSQTEEKTKKPDSFKNNNFNLSQLEEPLAVHYENEAQELIEENKTKIENDKNKNNQSMQDIDSTKKTKKFNEWESKLYLDINKSDSLKRNSWQTARVQLPIVDLESPKTESQRFSALFEPIKSKEEEEEQEVHINDNDNDDESDESEFEYFTHGNNEGTNKYEINQNFIKNESTELEQKSQPKPKPRNIPNIYEAPTKEMNQDAYEKMKLHEQEQKTALDNIKMHLGYNNTHINEKAQDVPNEVKEEMHNVNLKDACNEEDRRILNFINDTKMRESTPIIEQTSRINADKREKRFGKFKTFNEGGKQQNNSFSSSPRSNERIIIGHEMKSMSHAERRSEMTEALAKKYDGKSREELMLIANGMENEVLIYRQRVKELEDYLDNLLLRVMETHPKILQNPYSRTKSTKSG